MGRLFLFFLCSALLLGCGASDDDGQAPGTPQQEMYFPPLTGDSWETQSMDELGWNQAALQPLYDYLELKHSKSFMILVNGRIVVEHYFNGHSASSPWYWASAGKTLTSSAVGVAQGQGLLDVDAAASAYLGQGWTSLTANEEAAIKVKHLLSMTSGLDDEFSGDCVAPDCLVYAADPGTRWAYCNVYVKLQDVVAAAAATSWNDYFDAEIKNRIGMTGLWTQLGDLSVYYSNTRSMARFGLLALNHGKWQDAQIIPQSYMAQATTTSQYINKSYGYLWWINGEPSYHLPQSQLEFPGSLIPNGPNDMYMALGKNDQKIYVVPSRHMVVIRMGDAADGSNFALSGFDNALWEKINALID